MINKTITIRPALFAILTFMSYTLSFHAKVVTENQAATIAERLMSVQNKKVTIKHLSKSKFPYQTTPLYYIFVSNDRKGFVIVAADDIARPILGYSTDAEITIDGELPLSMEEWLTSIAGEIRQAQENGIQQSSEIAEQWKAASVGSTVVQLQTAEWGQGAPFNRLCPLDHGERSLTGCVPTAYAILMKYYNYPQTGKGKTQKYVTGAQGITVPSRSLEHTYDWDDMPMKYINGQYSTSQANKVATLMSDIGAALQVDYTKSNTSGYMGRGAIYTNFDYFPGTCRLKDTYDLGEWEEMMRNELDMKRPVVYRADNTESGGGHAFLLDGYTDAGYFSVNWGWDGNFNGFFTLDALTPGNSFYSSGQVAYLNTVPIPSNNAAFEVQIDGQDYPALTAAFDEASSDGTPATITLLSDAQVEVTSVAANKDFTLDVGDHSIDILSGINNYGNLSLRGTARSLLNIFGNAAIFNYGSLNISGGTYKNVSTIVASPDYRRCIWTAEGTNTIIEGGTFSAPVHALCFNGEATIQDGEFINTNGSSVIGCAGKGEIHGGTFESEGNVIHIWDNNNDLTIEGGTFLSSGNNSVINNYNSSGNLKIRGGKFVNNASSPSGSDYRRAVWTAEGTNSVIEGGSFFSPNHALCFNGDATIVDGEFVNTEGNPVIGCAGRGEIHGGTFESEGKVIFIWDNNNDLTISGGSFTSLGNSSVISNYNESGNLIIQGGTFANNAPTPSGADYRRAVWTDAKTNTIIENGTFDAAMQVLCFNGNATIYNAMINNTEDGYGVLASSNSLVSVMDCKLKANKPFYTRDGATIACEGGIFSEMIDAEFIKDKFECIKNIDSDTCEEYPYSVVRIDETNVAKIYNETSVKIPSYNMNGQRVNDSYHGIIIQDGKKLLMKH